MPAEVGRTGRLANWWKNQPHADGRMTRSFAIFVASLACLVLAAPFADRKDWQGWGASIVVFGALGTMLVLWLRRFLDNVADWWRGDRESPF